MSKEKALEGMAELGLISAEIEYEVEQVKKATTEIKRLAKDVSRLANQSYRETNKINT